MKLESKFDLKSIRTTLNDVQREFNVIGKRIENLGLSKADYDTIAAILTKRYQEVTEAVSKGQEVVGVTDVLAKARKEREGKTAERKANWTKELTELKAKPNQTVEEQARVIRLEKLLKTGGDAEDGAEAAAASGEAFV